MCPAVSCPFGHAKYAFSPTLHIVLASKTHVTMRCFSTLGAARQNQHELRTALSAAPTDSPALTRLSGTESAAPCARLKESNGDLVAKESHCFRSSADICEAGTTFRACSHLRLLSEPARTGPRHTIRVMVPSMLR